ncbi:MAG: IPT/TIG domain-containing protein, partial [Planctomycetota bacterium]
MRTWRNGLLVLTLSSLLLTAGGCGIIGVVPLAAAISIGLAMQEDEEEQEPAPTSPEVAGISPSTGVASGGTAVQIFGNRFQSGATVAIGGLAATNVVVVDGTEITCDTPPGNPGPADVLVTNPDGQSGALPGGFSYYLPPPDLVLISPVSGPYSGGTRITLTGTGFQAGATVTVGGNPCTNLDDTGVPTQILCDTPAGPPGTADVVVTNPDSQNDLLAGAFTYEALQVSSTFPAADTQGVYLDQTITLQFNLNVDPATVSAKSVQVTGPTGVKSGDLTVMGDQVAFTPVPAFASGNLYTITLPDGSQVPDALLSTSGLGLASVFSFTFRTGSQYAPDTDPPSLLSVHVSDGTTSLRSLNISGMPVNTLGVSPATSVIMRFDEGMDPASFTTTTVALTNNTSPTVPIGGTFRFFDNRTRVIFYP